MMIPLRPLATLSLRQGSLGWLFVSYLGEMKVEDADEAWLSNWEVYQHLCEQKEKRERLALTLAHPPKTPENILTIEFETLASLQSQKNLTQEKMTALLEILKDLALSKAERLQIVNLLPSSLVEFYLVLPFFLTVDCGGV